MGFTEGVSYQQAHAVKEPILSPRASQPFSGHVLWS